VKAIAPCRIGPFSVPPIGLGCRNLSHAYGAPPSAEAGERLLLAALHRGVTLLSDTPPDIAGFNARDIRRSMPRFMAAFHGRVFRPRTGPPTWPC